MHKLVLIRHGQSQWNLDNRFSGWADVDLTEQGRAEAREAGRLLTESGYSFDVAHTSVLKRAVRTLWGVQDEMGLMWLLVVTDWRLNERHYGGLTGLNKAETAAKYGEEQVKIWRRSYDVPPPPLDRDKNESVHDPRYATLDPKDNKVLLVPLSAPLTAGTYTVAWHALSSDGHKTTGTYSFIVK